MQCAGVRPASRWMVFQLRAIEVFAKPDGRDGTAIPRRRLRVVAVDAEMAKSRP